MWVSTSDLDTLSLLQWHDGNGMIGENDARIIELELVSFFERCPIWQ